MKPIRVSGFGDAAHQAWMVLDSVRVDAYAAAIRELIQPGDVVLDVGTGTGLLALLAARAGAKRVYGVERTGMASMAIRHASENGFGDVVSVVRRDLLEVGELDPRPNVIIGEVLGLFAADEEQHHLYAYAKAHAAPGARFMPESYRLLMAAARSARIEAELEQLGDVHGLSLGALQSRLRHRTINVQLEPDDLIGPEVRCDTWDSTGPLPERYQGRCPVESDGPVTGIAVSFEAQLSPSVLLSTGVGGPGTCWGQMLLPVHPPLESRRGDELDVSLRPRIVSNHSSWAWTVRNGEEIRRMDAIDAVVGDASDLALAFGLAKTEIPATPRVLQAWAAALSGGPAGEQIMAERLARALPDLYPDESAARQEVRKMMTASFRGVLPSQ